MMIPPSQLLAQDQGALQQGDKDTARILLTRLVEQEPGSEAGWLWLSAAVDTPADQRQCLEQVLAINPANPSAQQGLAHLGSATVAADPLPPAPDIIVCPACRQLNPSGRKFCGACGKTLRPVATAASVTQPTPTPSPPPVLLPGPGSDPPYYRPPPPSALQAVPPPPYQPPPARPPQYVAAPRRAAPPSRGVLTDFLAFRTLISHTLIQVVYVLGLVFICATGGISLLNDNWTYGLGVLIIGNILWRVVCEWMILFYSMHQRLVSIERELRHA